MAKKLKFFLLMIISGLILFSEIPAFAQGPMCDDGLGQRMHGYYLAKGKPMEQRWFADIDRRGCSRTWDVYWQGPNGEKQEEVFTVIRRENMKVSLYPSNCGYWGDLTLSSSGAFIVGTHTCGSRGGTFQFYLWERMTRTEAQKRGEY